MSISVEKIDLNVLNMHTRFPFKYGIASLVALPHLFVRARVKIDGKTEIGLAAEGLPPKWFTKNPDAPFESDLDEMLTVIQNACDIALHSDAENSVFDLWQTIYAKTARVGHNNGLSAAPMVIRRQHDRTRQVIDAFCRAKGVTFAQAIKENTLGIRLADIHSELHGNEPGDLLPQRGAAINHRAAHPWASPIH